MDAGRRAAGRASPPATAPGCAPRPVPGPAGSSLFDAALDQHHPAGIPAPPPGAARRPARSQGQGTGTALLDAYHQILDHTGTPAYLEAADLRTRGVYLRRGYADHGRPIRLPDGPLMYPMMREPPTQPRQLRGSLGEGASDA